MLTNLKEKRKFQIKKQKAMVSYIFKILRDRKSLSLDLEWFLRTETVPKSSDTCDNVLCGVKLATINKILFFCGYVGYAAYSYRLRS